MNLRRDRDIYKLYKWTIPDVDVAGMRGEVTCEATDTTLGPNLPSTTYQPLSHYQVLWRPHTTSSSSRLIENTRVRDSYFKDHCRLRHVDVDNSILYNYQIEKAILKGSELQGCVLRGCSVDENMKLKDCMLFDCAADLDTEMKHCQVISETLL
jgi:hypothetical protein